jgi:iron complex outermembrane recepter protein
MSQFNSKKQVTRLSKQLIRNAVHLAVLAALAAGGTAAQAQQAPAAAATDTAETAPLQEVIVTGTMIKRPNAETAEAVTILKADLLKDEGITDVEQAMNTLTANNPSINIAQAIGTFSGGGTYANLRGLGDGRTLVLLDGQRLANNAFTGNAVDLSGIPFSAIDNVQVLREGASALYGSDAIAGVINFITKKNYQGAEVQMNFDHPQDPGGASGQAEFTLGHGDLANDGYNVMVTGSYSKQQELRATQRDFTAQGFYPAGGYTSTNDPGTWPGTFLDANGNWWQANYPACTGNPELTTYFGNCAYRYSAATDLLPKHDEASAMLALTKALPGNNQVQLQYFYSQSELTAWSGPMFYFFQMDPASPYYPKASQLTCIASESLNCALPVDLADGGDAVWSDPLNNRYSGNLNAEQRALLTFSGTNAGWDYTAQLNYSKNTNDNRNVLDYPNEAVLAPGGVLSDLINPFGPQSPAGQALINASYVNGVYQVGEDSRWSSDAHASHELGDAFNSGTPSTVAIGFDLGGERFTNHTTPYNDLVSAATGLTDTNVEGSRQTQALYMELDLPITKSLDVDLSDREDRYSDFGRTNNGKVSVRYQPFDILTFRGTASTGFRAPTLYDLYTPNFLAASSSGTMGEGNPFCQPGSYNTEWSLSTCDTQGIGLYGGNRNLTPETSQNFDLGLIVSPIQDMGITLDYYRILLKNTISAVPFSAIYGNPTGLSSYIVTNNSGTLTPTIEEATYCNPYTQPTCGYIVLTDQNTGKITTDGIDISIQYLQHTPIGTFHEDLEGTAVTQFLDQVYSGGPILNLVGEFNELAPSYRWEHNVRVDWTSPNGMFGGGLSNRFFSTYIDEYPDGNGNQRTVGSYSLFDGFVSVKPMPNLTVLFGIKNILDRNPPFTNSFQGTFAAGYNSLNADPLGRNFYINLKYKFF